MPKKLMTQLAVLWAAAVCCCGPAAATTVTYNFDETGWVNTAGTTENFAGTFTGTLEASGAVALSDLTGFTATITETNAQNDTKPIASFGLSTGPTGLSNFVFDSTANTLSLAANGSPGATICLGDSVTQGLCGPIGPRPVSMTGVPAPPLEGIFLSSVNGTLNADSTALPNLILEATLPIPVVVESPTSTTPEPASFWLCGSALLLVSLVLRTVRAER
jgi:hypothetical protein